VTLRTMLRQSGLPLRRALDLARQIAAALAAGHAQEISHGRLKPENILVQAGAQSGDLVKVVDFGMAQLPIDVRSVVGGENEARRLALRTRIYLPRAHLPGIEALPPSPAIDAYSLGVVLFEMIAGQPPFFFVSAGWPNLQGGPIGFAQCNPQLQVAPGVEELVSVLLRPDSQVSVREALGVIEQLLGRASVAPAAARVEVEPVTSQLPSSSYVERSPSIEPHPPSERGLAPELRQHSFPPLPPGFPISQSPPGSLREPVPYPSPAPPPPAPSGSYPPLTLDQNLLGSLQPPGAIEAAPFGTTVDEEEAEAEFRPSLLARLRRMFGRSKPGGDL
jgi:serine/threonine-protein kinase